MANIFTGLVPIEQQGERVLTTTQLAQFYGCDAENIKINFNRNKARFKEGKHYFKLEGEVLSTFKDKVTNCNLVQKQAKVLYLWTKRGTARHAKMLGTDRAWDVFEALEENYFAPRKSPSIADIIANPDLGIALLTQLKEERAKTQALTEKVATQAQQIDEMKPKASYYDLVLACKDAIPISVIARDYGESAQGMNKKLHALGVQYKQGNIWLLYQKYARMGYTNTRTHTYLAPDGETHTAVHMYWTQKGRLFIYGLLKSKGILPLIEQDTQADCLLEC